MYGAGVTSKYDYEQLAYEPPSPDELLGANYFATATPCRAILHAETKDKKPGLLSAAKGLLKR
ncbi:MAG TPA: hypothetical protein VNA14_13325 [Mycobacteriales bacterium]|nr:hypothetical protein [Mycobacteriales bacterium]